MLRERTITIESKILRSVVEGEHWPAIVNQRGEALLAIQYQLDKSQWWQPEVLKAAQFQQLQGLLRHAAATAPFYGERFARSGIDINAPLDEGMWSNIPLLVRRDIKARAMRFTAP